VHVPCLNVLEFLSGRNTGERDDGHQADTRLDQPPGHQQVLPQRMHAITMPLFVRFEAQIKRPLRVGAGNKIYRLLLQAPETGLRFAGSKRVTTFE